VGGNSEACHPCCRVTINENGELTAEVSNISTVCKVDGGLRGHMKRLVIVLFVLIVFSAGIPVSAKPKTEPFLRTTLACEGQEPVEALITPGGAAVNLIVPSDQPTDVFVAVRAATEEGVVFSLPAGAIAALVRTRDLLTCTFTGPVSGATFTVLGFFAA
jgi:hypothetical protein